MKHTSTYLHLRGTLRIACLTFTLLLTGSLLRAQPGTIDPSFNPIGLGDGANNTVVAIALQPDGKILIGGFFTMYNSTPRSRIARLNADGSLDMSFDPGNALGLNTFVNSIVLQPDGKILIGGEFFTYNGKLRYRIARLNADGSLDTSFDPGCFEGCQCR